MFSEVYVSLPKVRIQSACAVNYAKTQQERGGQPGTRREQQGEWVQGKQRTSPNLANYTQVKNNWLISIVFCFLSFFLSALFHYTKNIIRRGTINNLFFLVLRWWRKKRRVFKFIGCTLLRVDWIRLRSHFKFETKFLPSLVWPPSPKTMHQFVRSVETVIESWFWSDRSSS